MNLVLSIPIAPNGRWSVGSGLFLQVSLQNQNFKTISKIEPQSGVEFLEFDKTYIIVINIHKFLWLCGQKV